MWKLLKFQSAKYWTITIFASILTFIQVITDLVMPAIFTAMTPIIGASDDNIGYILSHVPFLVWTLQFTSRTEALTILGSSMGACALFGLLTGFLGAYLASKSAVNIAAMIRSNLFLQIQKLSSSNLDKFGTSSLLIRLTNDIALIQNMSFTVIRIMIRGPFLFVGGLIFSIMTDGDLSISLAVWIPLMIIAMMVAIKKASPLFGTIQKTVDALNVQSRENILGVRVIKSYNLESTQRDKFNEVNNRWNFYTTKAFKILSGLQPIILLIANLASLIILLIAKYPPHPIDSTLELGKLQSILGYQGYIIMGITISTMVLFNFVQSRASVKRVNEVLNDIPNIKVNSSGLDLVDGSIVFENVNFKYNPNSSENILNNINFSINSGETIGIIGSTGSGKSSIINLMARIYEPTTGNIIVGKRNIKDIDTYNLHNSVGYVFQENILFAGTIKSNLLFGNDKATNEEIDEALEIACAKPFINNFVDGINHIVEQRGKNLSGGQKQRVSIARTILRKPRILVLDDSTSALDAITDQNLRRNIKEKLKGLTTIIIAQKILSIKDSDKILVVDKGEIVGQGTHSELIKNCDVYKQIAVSQMSEEELANA
ncbi:ABC transporter ATP-binding protein [Mycoplasmoides pirum]|uniref:ABC transporter ATP-binding protein n=1 Tax=Mycoplasmoides pirum TaxID=2122 RepID=UPI000695C731|nr:ABC transporter ATP-binding protein [Mycoplasmoides pirum]